jgi:phosphoglucosamine mutase
MRTLPPGFSFAGMRVVLDCANGAATPLAPELFRHLGASVETLSAAPDGRNINQGCGALHPGALTAAVRARGARFGAAYDGDADRCILVDETGTIRDGDDILAVAATELLHRGHLGPGGVVLTVMANLGLENYLGKIGVDFVRAPVGDKYVLEEMLRRGARLGGEQSGHIIFLEHATTGDGLLTSLQLAALVAARGEPLSALASCWTRLPQVLRNVRVRERIDLRTVPPIAGALGRVEAAVAGQGRLLVRYSGTEPLVRIMLEGQDQGEIEGHAAALAEVIQATLG